MKKSPKCFSEVVDRRVRRVFDTRPDTRPSAQHDLRRPMLAATTTSRGSMRYTCVQSGLRRRRQTHRDCGFCAPAIFKTSQDE
jgi:hypothetical protein